MSTGKSFSLHQSRLGLIPQALCALIDCEAAKVLEVVPLIGPDGQPLKTKKGKPRTTKIHELWKPDSGNAQSGAAGLTQFLLSTWLDHVLRPGFFIQGKSVEKGWVRQEAINQGVLKAALKKVVAAKPKMQWVFVLANGKTVTKPANHLSDANVKACVAMRMDPTWSINAAADYGWFNLKLLSQRNFNLGSLNEMEKAKIMYLMHHEGEGNGPLFISNTLADGRGGVEGLRRTFGKQFGKHGEVRAKALIDAANGDVEIAYRKWLSGYIDDVFSGTSKYFIEKPLAVRHLSDLLVAIGGVEIKKTETKKA